MIAQNLSEPFLPRLADSTTHQYISLKGISFLVVTITLEISGTLLIRKAVDDPRFYAIAFICYFSALSMFSITLQTVPLSMAYSTWCTLGTIGVTVMSKILFGEEIDLKKWICIFSTIPFVIGMYI